MMYGEMPEQVDWRLLVDMLRETFEHGDGGLAAASGIDPSTISKIRKRGLDSLKNGVTLWNMGVRTIGRTDPDRFSKCVIQRPEGR